MPMIFRDLTPELLAAMAEYPVVTVLGPRQSGKTTIARLAQPSLPYRSLEDPDVRSAAEADPRGFLADLSAGGILDEVQRLPSLLSYLQGLVDEAARSGMRARFILTGSHQPLLHEAISQSLAGRTAILNLWPFSLSELRQYGGEPPQPFALIVRGFYPRVHQESLDPRRFFNAYLQTYVERDVRALMQLRDLSSFQKFLTLLAGRVGQLVNASALANDVGVSAQTIRNWLSVLKASYVIFELPPYVANVRKRVVKSSKIYFADVGLAAFLLGIHTPEQAARDPLRGALYENLVIAEVLKGACNRGRRPDLFFYRDSHGNEVDLIIRESGKLTPIEIKSAATFAPDFTKGIARMGDAGIKPLAPGVVLYNGDRSFNVHGVRAFDPLRVDDLWSELVGPA
jgi:uncharacterized protein